MSDVHSPDPMTIAQKMEWLFAHVFDENNQPFTMTEIAKRSGLSISQLRNVRMGNTPNPGLQNIKAICAAFGVTPRVFLDDDGIQQTEAELALLEVLKRREIRDLALRAQELGPDAVRLLAQFIDALHDQTPKPDEK